MTEPVPTPPTFYGVSAEDVRNVIPPNSRGATDPLIHNFLEESVLDVTNEIGELPMVDGSPDPLIRAVVRDLAGARTILKLVGTDNDEGRRAGQALDDYAWKRLERWEDNKQSIAGESGTDMLHNVFPEPVFGYHKSGYWLDYPLYPGAPWAE